MNKQEFLSCLDKAATEGAKPLNPAVHDQLRLLAKYHREYQRERIPQPNIFLAGSIPKTVLQKLLEDPTVNSLRIYVACQDRANPMADRDYTFLTLQCDVNGNDIVEKSEGVYGWYSDACCKCPPESCDGASLLR